MVSSKWGQSESVEAVEEISPGNQVLGRQQP